MPQPSGCPENLMFINFSIGDFCDIASKKTGISVKLSSNFLYKICDFKPAFGLIYEDYLRSYDFWGHCDLDIIWGRIRYYITDELLKRYDIITSRKNRISGHFCLYRNTQNVKAIFFSIPRSFELLRLTDSCERLDEEYFTVYLHSLAKPSLMSRIKSKFIEPKKNIHIFWDEVLTTSGKHQRALLFNESSHFKWVNGRVYNAEGEELMYIHFHVLKTLPSFVMCDVYEQSEEMTISPSGIRSVSKRLS